MHRIVYVSTATVAVTEASLAEYLDHWRRSNVRDGITGLLLYSETEGLFMQVIEGEHARLLALFEKITHDYRHRDLLKLADGPSSQRTFTEWTMGFKVVQAAPFAQLAGYTDPAALDFRQVLALPQDTLIRQLLEAFVAESAPGVRV